jgi:hypothetical protein
MRKREARLRVCAALVCGALFESPVAHAAPFASEVVSYLAGSNIPAGYDDPLTALGPPARSTGSGPFDGDVTPFNTPWRSEHVVSIGAGGSLVLRFDAPVLDDAANPFGIDLLIYGNAFLGIDFDTGLADGVLFSEPARIALSQDGQSWFDVGGVFADDLFPTLAYQDPPGPFDSGGTLPTSFTRPVDPGLTPADFVDLDVAAIAALYAGGAGGAGIDLAVLGLPWVQYVRIWQPETDTWSAEVDAIADVPGPGALVLLGMAFAALCFRRRTAEWLRRSEGPGRMSGAPLPHASSSRWRLPDSSSPACCASGGPGRAQAGLRIERSPVSWVRRMARWRILQPSGVRTSRSWYSPKHSYSTRAWFPRPRWCARIAQVEVASLPRTSMR